jgi:2-oxo-3-hexenedioate decarboxylase
MSDLTLRELVNPEALAALLDEAACGASEVDRLTLLYSIDLATAYQIQQRNIARRLKRGERPVGIKMGFTSVAKMQQMGVNESIWGRLTDAMQVPNRGSFSFSRYIHPRVEPEVAFLLKRPLAGNVSSADALAAVEAVAPAAEIIDSRYRDFKFTHVDVVADNTSAAAFSVGEWQSPRDLSSLAVSLIVDGTTAKSGSTAAILGDPLLSLVAAARLAEAGGEALRAGWIVLAGAATEAVALRPGMQVCVSVETLGDVTFTVDP